MALHGMTVIVLEAIALSLALTRPDDAMASLARLGTFAPRLALSD